MEISSSSGVVFRRPIPCGSVDHSSSSSSSSKAKLTLSLPTPTRIRVFNKLTLSLQQPSPSRIITKFSTSAAFSDTGHLNYYPSAPAVRCGGKDDKNKTTTTTTKKKLKLLKSLTKDLSMFSDFGFGLDPYNGQLQGSIVSEAADALLAQLQQVRAEEKELKRKKKLDKAQLKAKSTRRITTMLHSDSSNSSSGSTSTLPSSLTQEPNTTTTFKESSFEDHNMGNLNTCSTSIISTTENHALVQSMGCDGGNGLVSSKRIEVCMGGKCKKSGGAELVEEFGRAIGSSNVVGCKCMGKCKDGPNVRVLNCFDDSVRTPTNPLCIGVGLADVGVILANFFGEDGSFAPSV